MPILEGGKVLASGSATVFTNAGAPTVNVTKLGIAAIGDLLSDTTNGKLYICTATNNTSTIVWTVVGSQV